MTSSEAASLVAILAELFDQPTWTEGRLRLFRESILDLDFQQARSAVRTWIETKSQRPQPADIRRIAVESALNLPEPEEAYGMVKARFASHGPTDLPKAIMDAVEMTGKSWDDLAYMQFDQYPWFRRDFLNAYREVRNKCVLTGQQDPSGLLASTGRSAVERAQVKAFLSSITKGNA